MSPHDLRCRVQTVELRHRDVEHNYFRLQRPRHLDRGPPIRRFANDLNIGLFLEQRARPLADNAMVIGDQNPNHHDFPFFVLGKFARTVVPPPGAESTANSPPSSSTRSRIPSSPIPVAPPGVKPIPLSFTVSTTS